MASILRSDGKFARYFAGFARDLVLKTHRKTERNIIKHSQALCTTFSKGFASTIQRTDQNLDKSMKKLDNAVRGAGRITRRDIEEVLKEIRLHRTVSSSQSLLVIRCCGNLVPEELPEIRTALVQETWKTLNNVNVPMDVSHYNALLQVYLENEHPFSPTEFLADLESKSVKPNTVTYQRLISRYCQEGDIDGATRIVELSEADDIESLVDSLSVMKGKELLDVIYRLATNGHNVDRIIPRLWKSADYNHQDAVNLIVRLVNKGQEDVGFEILKTMPRRTRTEGDLSDTGAFLVRQLVKSKCSAKKVMAFCKELQETGLNDRAILIALESSATSGNIDIAVPFFKEIAQADLPIRQHYFWPLIVAQGEIGPKAVLDLIRLMKSEFQITPNNETIREYVVPSLRQRDYNDVILLLESARLSSFRVARACVYDALIHFRIKEAATLTSSYRNYYQPGILRRPLVDALVQTKDYESYISILRTVHECLHYIRIEDPSIDEPVDDMDIQLQSDVVGQFVVDAVIQLHNTRAEAIQKILSALVKHSISMSKAHAEHIQERLGSVLTPELSTMLDQLTASDWETTIRVVKVFIHNDRIDEAVAFLNANKRADKSKDVRSKCWEILNQLAQKGDDENLTKVFNALEENNFVEINNNLLCPLIHVHLVNDDMTKAMSTFEAIATKYNCTPWKDAIERELIYREDATNLQLLIDLSTNVHGLVNSLYDLVLSFVDCGRIRQACKILETPELLRSRPKRVNDVCEGYHEETVGSLEALVQASRDINHIVRYEIFYNILLNYYDSRFNGDSSEKPVNPLWTKIQEEEDEAPTDQFFSTLAQFLKEKNVEESFVSPFSESSKRDPAKNSNQAENVDANKGKVKK